MIRKLLICMALAVTAAGAMAAEDKKDQAPWHMNGWAFRKVLQVRGRAPAAWVETDMGGWTAARGADLRVVAHNGKQMNLDIIHATSEGRFLVLFETAAGPGLYYLYSGREAPPPRAAWHPKIGLVLEVRTRGEGKCDNWEQMKELIAASEEVQGVAFRSRIFDGYNPFGPSVNYVSIYKGWLRCKQPGVYHFSTVSDDASFLFVNDKLVCQWPGIHRAHGGRRNAYQGQIRLIPGAYKITYYHVQYGDQQSAAAAWKPPGAKHFEIIPPGGFVLPSVATELRGELRFRPVTADFQYEPVAYLEAEGAKMTAVRFRFSGALKGTEVRRCTWDFGDGVTATGEKLVHAFTAMGVYPVELTVLTGRARARHKTLVHVGPKWDDLDFRQHKINMFVKLVKDSPYDKMPAPSLAGAMRLFKMAEDQDELRKVCQALYEKRANLGLQDRYDFYMWFGESLVGSTSREAVRLYQLALETAGQDKAKGLQAEMKIADALFYYQHNHKDALELYQKIRQKYVGGDAVTLHMAHIRIGDVYRAMGKGEEAATAYREAENDPRWLPKQPKSVLTGGYAIAVETKIRENKADDALELLDKWEWQFPTSRLDGYNLVLRAKANMITGDYAEARKQGRIFSRFSRDPNYLPEALMVTAQASKALADYRVAREHCRRVVKEYPESPAADTARGMLKQLEKLIVE